MNENNVVVSGFACLVLSFLLWLAFVASTVWIAATVLRKMGIV